MTENKNLKKSKYRKIIKIGIFLVLILTIVLGVIRIRILYLESKINNNITKEIIDINPENNQKEKIVEDLVLNLETKEAFLENRIKNLEENLLLLQTNIENIQANVIRLENNNPTNNEKNLQIVVLLYKIKDVVNLGGNFIDYLENLKILTKNRNFIYDNVIKLEQYKSQKTQKELKNVFFNDYIKINSNENNSKIKYFLAENIKIRKISDFNNTDNYSLNINNIENFIDKFNYNNAVDIIVENSYEEIFSNTLKILQEKQEALNIIEEILNFVYEINKI